MDTVFVGNVLAAGLELVVAFFGGDFGFAANAYLSGDSAAEALVNTVATSSDAVAAG